MSRDIYYTKMHNSDAVRAPKVTDMDALKDVLSSEPYSQAIDHVHFGETRNDSSYPITIHKTLKGFQFYGTNEYVISSLGFNPNNDNELFLDFWESISDYTEPFNFWIRNGHPVPVVFRPEELEKDESIYHLSFANGELVEAEEYTLGLLNTEDVTPDTEKNG